MSAPVGAATGWPAPGPTTAPTASAPVGGRAATAVYVVVLAACALFSVGWLTVGLVAAVVRYWPGAMEALRAAGDGGWTRGLLAAAPNSEPLAQAVLDLGFSVLNLVLAAVLLRHARRSWSLRLLVIAMIGSAGAFNLQAHAAAVAVEIATGLSVGELHQIVLHAVACAAFVLALLVFPTASWPTARGWRGPAGRLLAAAGAAILLLVGFGTAVLPHTTSCILFFGFLVPVAGLVALPTRVRRGATGEQRTQARLLFSALAATFATAAVLAVVTLALQRLGQPGLTLVDPTAHGSPSAEEPIALLFWFSRLASAAIAGAVLVATVGAWLWTAEQLFSRGLAITLVAAVTGGAYAVVWAAAGGPMAADPGALLTAALAALPVALVFLPLYMRVETLVDRMLYGTRPTPYSVLAGVAALSQTTASDAPDLARVAEAVGRGLGAAVCRLTVYRPGLRDRTYAWSARTGDDTDDTEDDLVAVPVRQGDEELGEIAVDRAAVAGLHHQRRHLLDDIADSLGVVLQASRSGIELERQLRAAVAHGERIAVARRDAVAEMDRERRRIERDLHDGAQHHLVTLGLTLGLVEHQVETGQVDAARERLDKLLGQLDVTEAVLSETATGVSSVVLHEQGLVAALSAALSGADPPVTVSCDGPAAERRYPEKIADTAYFCCLEAVNNARKHAPGSPVTVDISERDGVLRTTVSDTGPGFTPEPVPAGGVPPNAGRGMRNLTARLAAVGGTVAIRSAPGEGTTVEAALPVPAEAAPVEAATTRIAATEHATTEIATTEIAAVGTAGGDAGAVPAGGVSHPGREVTPGAPAARVAAAAGEAPSTSPTTTADLATTRLTTVVDAPTTRIAVVATATVEEAGPRPTATPAPGGPVPTEPAPDSPVPDSPVPGSPVPGKAPEPEPEPVGLRGRMRALLRSADEVYGGTDRAGELAVVATRLDGPGDPATDVADARAALAALEDVVRNSPLPGDRTHRLRYEIERIRAGAPELTGADPAELLRAGAPTLPEDVRLSAERLLGTQATGPRARLGLGEEAGQDDVRRAAATELARWQRWAAHPGTTGTVRDLAQHAVLICEHLLADAGPG